MNYQEVYQDVIQKLKRGERPLVKLEATLIAELKTAWMQALSSEEKDDENIKKILCILDNSQTLSEEFNECFEKTLNEIKQVDLIVFTLSASHKHIVEQCIRTGKMPPHFFCNHLKDLLKSQHPEVVEWTLRTIEALGPVSLRFKAEVLASKPGFSRLFNRHQKASSQIIELLEKRWRSYL